MSTNDNTESADEFDTGTDYNALSDWAENEMSLPKNSATARRGPDAAAAGKALLERVGGRPSLDPNAAPGTVSPVRQVRLPETLNNRLTALAAQQGRKPSEIIRDAISEYADTHSATA